MDNVIHIIEVGISLLGAVLLGLLVWFFVKRGVSHPKKEKVKTQDMVLKQVNKRLAQNPRDSEALFTLADIYFKAKSWDKAFKTYEILEELARKDQNIDAFQVHFHYALSALHLEQNEAARKGFLAAWSLHRDNLELNYNLGLLEFQQRNYEKAVQFFSIARKLDSTHAPSLRYLGHSFFKLRKYNEAMAFIRKAIELAPDDKESLYTLGECYFEVGYTAQALKIFTHLREDPVKGPDSSLYAGTINMNQHQIDQAIADFEIGLKHSNIKPNILLDLRYHLAIAEIKKNEIAKALDILDVIQTEIPNYKDVPQLLRQYRELTSSKNLELFMLASSADFTALCRKIVLNYYSNIKAKIKIVNIEAVRSDYLDITTEVTTLKWTDMIVFRFIRTYGSVGELVVRDFHARLKEMKAGKGICITFGTFSEDAWRYTEARLIDLVGKERLTALLNKLDSK